MKSQLLFAAGAFLLPALAYPAFAQSLDLGFAPPNVFAPTSVQSAVEQPDGKLVAAGNFLRVNGTPASRISRFNANGTLDAAFQQNVGTVQGAYEIELTATGQLLVSSGGIGAVTAGNVTKPSLLRLNADGTGDASFNTGTGPGGPYVYLADVLPLPNGQAIVVGYFTTYNGLTVNSIARLTATGAVDPTFNSGTGAGAAAGNDPEVNTIVRLPNGQFLIGGYFTTYNGFPCNGLARLNADGSFDATFSTNLGADSYIVNVVAQPDGKILLTGSVYVGSATSGQSLVRLLAAGMPDPAFAPPAFPDFAIFSYSGPAIQVQADGKILVASRVGVPSAGVPRLVRLNPNGSVDPSYQVGDGPNSMPQSIRLLANGRLLVAGSFTNFNGTLDRSLVQITSTGAVDASFQPVIQTAGSIRDVVQQPDGKLLVGGSFSEINGQAVRRVARFNPNGSLDATFAANADIDGAVVSLALQPDGRLLAANPQTVRRLLATGDPDNSFVAPDFTGSNITKLLLQPNGRIFVGGNIIRSNGLQLNQPLLRLLPNGTRDNSFALPASNITYDYALALQPDGKLLVADPAAVKRFDANGALDATFTGPTVEAGNLAVQPDGKILVGGNFQRNTGSRAYTLVRLNPNGTADASFAAPSITGTVNALLLQPNNRILLGGLFTGTGLPANLARLLTTGQADASFGATALPNATVSALLVQPDGKIVVSGFFSTLGGQPAQALGRITASNVLAVAAPQAVAARTEAWPVPAHGILNLALDATAHPLSIDVADVLGHPVLHQALNGASTATLAVGNLAPGAYLLRVAYAEGTVVRRIQVQ